MHLPVLSLVLLIASSCTVLAAETLRRCSDARDKARDAGGSRAEAAFPLVKLLLTAAGDSAHFRPVAARGGHLCAAVLQVEVASSLPQNKLGNAEPAGTYRSSKANYVNFVRLKGETAASVFKVFCNTAIWYFQRLRVFRRLPVKWCSVGRPTGNTLSQDACLVFALQADSDHEWQEPSKF